MKASIVSFVCKNRAYLVLFLFLIEGSLSAFGYSKSIETVQNVTETEIDSEKTKRNTIHNDSKSLRQNLVSDTNTREREILDLSNYYQSQEQEKQILIKRATLAEQNLVIQIQNHHSFRLSIFIITLSLIGVLFYNQKRFIKGEQQKETELQLAFSKIAVQNKHHNQYLNLSNELYATIGAKFAFIISSLDNLKYGFEIKDEKLTTKIKTISEFASGAIYELRDTVWALNKNEITLEDIQLRISNYIDDAQLYSSSIHFIFDVDASVNLLTQFTSIEGLNILYALKESIHNSLQYANATLIKVEVSEVVSNLVFIISDNGDGFDIDTIKKGNGISTMKKRIERIGGEVTINSSVNKGTEITVTVKNHKN